MDWYCNPVWTGFVAPFIGINTCFWEWTAKQRTKGYNCFMFVLKILIGENMKSTVLLSLLVMIMSYECARYPKMRKRSRHLMKKTDQNQPFPEPEPVFRFPWIQPRPVLHIIRPEAQLLPTSFMDLPYTRKTCCGLGISGKVNTEFGPCQSLYWKKRWWEISSLFYAGCRSESWHHP